MIRTVEALTRQTYKDWEIVISVGQDLGSGSLDDQNKHHESVNLLKKLACDDSRIRLLESGHQYDVFIGLNDCLKSVRGSYFKIMHPTEVLHTDALAIIMRNLAEHQDITHLTYEIEYPKSSQSTQLFPVCEELEKRRSEFAASLFSAGTDRLSVICSVFKCDQRFQFDPNFRFFAENVFLQFALENAKSLHVADVLGSIDNQVPSSVMSSELQWFILTGEIVIVASVLEAKHLSPSFSANATTIIAALESEIFARYQNLTQPTHLTHLTQPTHLTSSGDRVRFEDVNSHSAEHFMRVITATNYDKLKQVRDLEDSIHLKMLAVEELKKDKAEKQLLLDSLLKSRIWRYSEPLRSAKRVISRTLFSNK